MIFFITLTLGNTNSNLTSTSTNELYSFENVKSATYWDNTSLIINATAQTNSSNYGNWTWAVEQPWCSGSGTFSDPYIIENLTLSPAINENGLAIYNSFSYLIIRNVKASGATETFYAGFLLNRTSNATLYNCTAFNNDYGIHLKGSQNNTITNCAMYNNYEGIELESHSDYNYIQNNNLTGNTISGIDIWHGDFNVVKNNTANYNGYYGITTGYAIICENNTANYNGAIGIDFAGYITYGVIHNNTACFNDGPGIAIGGGWENNITFNNASYNTGSSGHGLRFMGDSVIDSFDNIVYNNTFSFNSQNGIYLSAYTQQIKAYNNSIFNNINGIRIISNSWLNIIEQNDIFNNSEFGILASSMWSDYRYNLIEDNKNGINFESSSSNNNIFENYFRNNLILHANQTADCINMNWNTTIGNYWDNYTGTDYDDNNIGDTPYVSGLITDNAPIYSDGPNTLPIITIQPGDFFYPVSATEQWLNWTVNDPDVLDARYTVRRNGSAIVTGIWSSGISIDIDITGLTEGSYNFTIQIDDGCPGDNVTDEVIVDVTDCPVISTSGDISYQEGSVDNEIIWTITDPITGSPSQRIFLIYIDTVYNSSGYWDSGVANQIDVDGLALGNHNITIIATDGLGMNSSDATWVTVNDVPSFTLTPIDVYYEEGNGNQWLNWTISDTIRITPLYTILRNNSIIETGNWFPGTRIDLEITGLSEAYYTFEIQIWDGYNPTNISDSVNVTVNNVPHFILPTPNDFIYQYGTPDNEITWILEDIVYSPNNIYRNYSIMIDDVFNTTGLWTPFIAFYVDVDGLDIGIHTIMINATDGLGMNITDLVVVYVNDAPSFSSAGTDIYQNIEENDITLNWTIHDTLSNITDYSVSQNGTIIKTDSWDSDVEINVIVLDLSQGFYEFTINAYDGLNALNITDTILVRINDDPILNSPHENEVLIIFIDISNGLVSWNVSDIVTGNNVDVKYSVIIDGNVGFSGIWISNELFSINLSSYSLGTHLLLMNATDGLGRNVSESINVILNDYPSFTTPLPVDVSFISGVKNQIISWTINDGFQTIDKTYTIYLDSIPLSGYTDLQWNPNSKIEVILDSFPIGRHNLTIVVNDGANGIIQNTVIVTVSPQTYDILIYIGVIGGVSVVLVVIIKKRKKRAFYPDWTY